MLPSKINVLIVSLFCIGCLNAIGQELNYKVTDTNGKEKLLGVINQEGLTAGGFQHWFNIAYNNYEVDEGTTQSIRNELKEYTIKVFMGTWCGDSKREVPRFYKVLEAANFPKEQLVMVAVDYLKPNYKKSPGGEEKGLNIIKVPTFIFYKDGKEANRIIEFPVVSLEKDINAIVNGKAYIPNYNDIPVLPVD